MQNANTDKELSALEQRLNALKSSVPCVEIDGAIYRADDFTALIPEHMDPHFPRSYRLERLNGTSIVFAIANPSRLTALLEVLQFSKPFPL